MENESLRNSIAMHRCVNEEKLYLQTGKIENEKSASCSVRMCIVCKKRDLQKNLIRLQCVKSRLVLFRGFGRSFYICKNCINTKNSLKKLSRLCNTEKEEIKKIIENFSFSILH